MGFPQQSYKSGVFAVLLATLGWSLSGLFVRLLPGLTGWQINCWRGLATAVVLLMFLLMRYRSGTVRKFQDLPLAALLLSALFFSVGSTVYVMALTQVSTATVAVIGATAPLFTGLLSPWITGERPGLEAWVGATLAVIGVVIIAGGQGVSGHIYGLLLSFLVPLLFAAQTLALRRYRHVDMVPAICVGGFTSFLLAGFGGMVVNYLSFGATAGGGFWVPASSLGTLALMGTVQLAIPLILYVIGARTVPAVTLVLLSMLDSVMNPLWPWVFLGERPTGTELQGGAVVVVAVLITLFGKKLLPAVVKT